MDNDLGVLEMYRLLATLMALSQRFIVTTDYEVGLQWNVGDHGITISDAGASFYMGDAHNNLSFRRNL